MNAHDQRPQGQIRQSQIITTFGPGAMVDLPRYAVVIGGLEHWRNRGPEIFEERLVDKIKQALQLSAVRLYAPPPDSGNPAAPISGITAWLFPEWFIATGDEERGDNYRSRPLIHRRQLTNGKYLGNDRRKYEVLPVRFVQACPNGHLSDLDWYGYVHQFEGQCRRLLRLEERGTSGDLVDILVTCDCGARRDLVAASKRAEAALGYCTGQRPWLGRASEENCVSATGHAYPNWLLVRSASNSYFPQLLSVISIPDPDEKLRKTMDSIWGDLEVVETLDELKYERKKAKVKTALEGLEDAPVLAEISRRRSGAAKPWKPIKQAEIEMLLSAQEEIGHDTPEGDFYARALKSDGYPKWLSAMLSQVVRVDRLKEVVAQVGFTRFEAASPTIDGELDVNVKRAELATDVSWLPAVENRGEGIFLGFRPEVIAEWVKRSQVTERGTTLVAGFNAWKRSHPLSQAQFPGLPYVLLHSLSHLLITAVSLECGYSASSIRERIYAGDSGYGILLYTATPDAEGTLGGLAMVGRKIDLHLRNALEMGRLCSNDPVCAQHRPDNPQEERFLHGAACHGCLLIAETSCERYNEYLDRELVVPTVMATGVEFVEDMGS
jgi:Domain of unknown function (DUF1998)